MGKKNKINPLYLKILDKKGMVDVNIPPPLLPKFKELEGVKMVDIKEQNQIILDYKQRKPGCDKAFNELIKGYQKFCFLMSIKYMGQNCVFDDVMSEANLGLLKAVETFDPSYEVTFLTYASSYVFKYIINFVNTDDMIKQPNILKYKKLINKIKNQYETEYHRKPTSQEIVDGLKKFDINIRCKSDMDEIHYFDIQCNIDTDDYENCWWEYPDTDEVDYEVKLNEEYVLKLFQVIGEVGLNDIEYKVLKLYFGFDGGASRTLTEISQILDLCYYIVKKSFNTGLKKIQKYSDKFDIEYKK